MGRSRYIIPCFWGVLVSWREGRGGVQRLTYHCACSDDGDVVGVLEHGECAVVVLEDTIGEGEPPD